MDKPENNGTVNPNGASEEVTADKNTNTGIQMKLSLKSETAYMVRNMHRELMKEEIAKLPPINEGEVDINGSYIVPTREKVDVGFYIRNGHARPIRLSKIPLVITDKEGNVLAKQVFDLGNFGTIPSHSARPGEVHFDRENIFADISMENWKIEFAEEPKLDEFVTVENIYIPKKISEEQVKYLKSFMEKLPPLKIDTVAISPFQAALKDDDGSLMTTVIVRNGRERLANFKNLNITIMDAKKREVASGKFSFNINPLSAGLWTFVFAPENILVKDLDLSNWSLQVKK